MNKICKLTLLIAFLSLCFSVDMLADVISDINVTLDNGSELGADYKFTVIQDEYGDFTSIWFDLVANTLIFKNSNIDEASDWYLTEHGDEFTKENINNDQFPMFVRVNEAGLFESNNVFVGISDFYLGINTGTFAPRSAFGWVHLQNDSGTLSMLGNAMTYQTDGIIIGTTSTIPEPGLMPLLFAGVLFIGGVHTCPKSFVKRKFLEVLQRLFSTL